jgi:hypothetical protein
MSTGLVLDIYDDPQGDVLCSVLKREGIELSEKVASTRLLEPQELGRLPDRLFALVGSDGNQLLRKYAMHDEMHLRTSILYFLEAAPQLSEEVRAKVATNLVNACGWYEEVELPEPLLKLALSPLTVGMGALAAAGGAQEVKGVAAKSRSIDEDFRRAQVAGTKTAAGVEVEWAPGKDIVGTEMRALGTPDRAAIDKSTISGMQLNAFGKQKRDSSESMGPFGTSTKKADLIGSEVMPVTATTKKPSKGEVPSAIAKMASALPQDHLTVDGPLRQTTRTVKVAEHVDPVIGVPLDTAPMIKRAASYFEEHKAALDPAERRAFAAAVEKRAADLGVSVEGAITGYFGDDYGPNCNMQMIARINNYANTEKVAGYEALLALKPYLEPSTFAQKLAELDKKSGAANAYGKPFVGFLDPYATVFGKVAEEEVFSWAQGNDYTNQMRLEALSTTEAKLDNVFGAGFAVKFRSDPVGVFKSLPDDKKVIISRIAAGLNKG